MQVCKHIAMQDDDLKEKIRDGTYFQEARKWYSTVYMSLISERVFYVILTSASILTLLIAISSVSSLMPLSPTVPLFIRSDNVLRNLPRITPLSTEPEEANISLRRFYAGTYVKNREIYSKNKVNELVRFVFNHSDSPTYETFKRYYDTTNPRSPIVRYAALADRYVQIQNVDVRPNDDKPGKYEATVFFVAILSSYEGNQQSFWRADLTFDYQDLVVEQAVDKTIDTGLKITPMKFRVTSYNVRELKSPS